MSEIFICTYKVFQCLFLLEIRIVGKIKKWQLVLIFISIFLQTPSYCSNYENYIIVNLNPDKEIINKEYCQNYKTNKKANNQYYIEFSKKDGKRIKKIENNRKIVFSINSNNRYQNIKGRLIEILRDSVVINIGNNENFKIQTFHINEFNMIGFTTPITNAFTASLLVISPNGIIYPFYRKIKKEKGWLFKIVKE